MGWGRQNPNYKNNRHVGEDLIAPTHGMDVRAIGEGKVMLARPWSSCPNWGHLVVIYHGDRNASDVSSIYGHLDPATVTVREGQDVTAGTAIGKTGSYSCWVEHLHFGIHVGAYGKEVGGYPTWLSGYLEPNRFPEGYVQPSTFLSQRARATYAIAGPNAAIDLFLVDNFVRVLLNGRLIGDFGNLEGDLAGPATFQAAPGDEVVVQAFDDGSARVLGPLWLYKNGAAVRQLTAGVPRSCCTPCCNPPGIVFFTQTVTLP